MSNNNGGNNHIYNNVVTPENNMLQSIIESSGLVPKSRSTSTSTSLSPTPTGSPTQHRKSPSTLLQQTISNVLNDQLEQQQQQTSSSLPPQHPPPPPPNSKLIVNNNINNNGVSPTSALATVLKSNILINGGNNNSSNNNINNINNIQQNGNGNTSQPGSPSHNPLRKHAQRKYNAVASFLSLSLKDENGDANSQQQSMGQQNQQNSPQSSRLSWTDFESEYEREVESIPTLLRFPTDIVAVKNIEKKSKFVFAPTTGLVPSALDTHVRDIIHHYNKDYLIVQHRTIQQLSSSSSTTPASTTASALATIASSLAQSTTSLTSSGSILKSKLFQSGKQILNRVPTTTNTKKLGSNNGGSIETSITNDHDSNNIIGDDPLKQLIPERFGLELLCEVKELKLQWDIEPFFCSLYIVDLEKRERISENFNFHLNTKSLFDSLKISEDLSTGLANQKQCAFSLNKYHPNMYFILRVYHIFKGDIERDVKPYLKDFKKQSKPNVLSQFKTDITDICMNWGSGEQSKILQPFVWMAFPVFHRPTLTSQNSSLNVLQQSIPTPPPLPTQGINNNNSIAIESLKQKRFTPPPTSTSSSAQSSPSPSPSMPSLIHSTSSGDSPLSSMLDLKTPTLSPILQSLSNVSTPPIQSVNSASNQQSSVLSPVQSPSHSSTQNNNTGNNKTTIEITSMVPASPNYSDRSICELLLNDKDLKKIKTVPANFTMSIRTMTSDEGTVGRINPSLIPLNPPPSPSSNNNNYEQQYIREIQDFTEQPFPHVDYVNNLYIYPETCFIKFKNPNIQIQVQLVDDLSCLKSLKCIYPSMPPYIPSNVWDSYNIQQNHSTQPPPPPLSPTIPFPPLDYYGFSGVSFHEKRPHFTEEFKIKLPTRITTQHLLFTFYHVNVASSTSKKDQKTAIGYSAVPLLTYLQQPTPSNNSNNQSNGLFLKDDIHFVSITSELNGIESMVLNNEESKKEKCQYFSFRSKLVSSVITQDQALNSFYRYCCNNNNNNDTMVVGKTLESVKGIQKIDRLSCVQHFPFILDQLFQIMCLSSNDVASQAFTSILHVIKIVDGYEKKAGTEKSRLLTFYAEYLFDYIPDSKYVYEELCRQWVNAINTGIYVKDFRLNWFLFDIMTKSMALTLSNSSLLSTDLSREKRFQVEFQENLKQLVLKLLPQISDSNISPQSWEFFFTKFPYFINNLFPLIDRGFLFNLIYNYISRLAIEPKSDLSSISTSSSNNNSTVVSSPNQANKESDNNNQIAMITIKFNFLKIICDYDHYIPLNFPQPLKSIDSISELPFKFFKRHFIAVLLLNEVESCLRYVRTSLRNQAILTLKQLLKKHHFDSRYQDNEIREKISSIYFPFVLMMVEHYTIFKHSLEPNELIDWLTCLIWILQYCNRDLLQTWLMKETETRKNALLGLLLLTLEIFKEEASISEVIVLDIEICKLILIQFKSSIDDKLFNNVFNNIQKCLSIATLDILPEIYNLIRETLIPNYQSIIYQNSNNNYCEHLSYELLRSSSIIDSESKLSNQASSLFYYLIEQNYLTTSTDIGRVKIQATVAFSKLVGEYKLENEKLQPFLTRVKQQSNESNDQQFKVQIEELIKKINTLMKYSNTITENRSDNEMIAEMYYNISNSYFESPNLRVTWLENLSKKHFDNRLYDEAAQCLIQSAYLIARYLTISGKLTISLQSDFATICPNIGKELELPQIDLKDDTMFLTWTSEYLVQLLEQSIGYATKAERFELAIEIYSLISNVLKSKKDYKALINVLSNQKLICETIEKKSKEIRLQSKYYRIGFYGIAFEDLDGKEYIYKKPADCLLKHITTQIQDQIIEKFSKQQQQTKDIKSIKTTTTTTTPPTTTFDKEKLVLLPNNQIDRSTLLPDKLYYQIVSVDPYIESTTTGNNNNNNNNNNQNHQHHTSSTFDPSFGISQFISEIAYSQVGGKSIQEDLSKQSKKKTIFVTAPISLPYLKNRIEITDKREIILSPIENAIELVKGRVLKLMEQCQSTTPRINLLQQVIQGSVVPMVNEGPLKICEVFLSKQIVSQYNKDHVDILKKTLEKFLYYCGLCILLNKRYLQPQHQDFQTMVEKQFDKLKLDINQYIN